MDPMSLEFSIYFITVNLGMHELFLERQVDIIYKSDIQSVTSFDGQSSGCHGPQSFYATHKIN